MLQEIRELLDSWPEFARIKLDQYFHWRSAGGLASPEDDDEAIRLQDMWANAGREEIQHEMPRLHRRKVSRLKRGGDLRYLWW